MISESCLQRYSIDVTKEATERTQLPLASSDPQWICFI